MISAGQMRRFHEDGFLVVENFLSREVVELACSRFEPLFRGEFPTGLQPDEWNWREGRDPADRTRQICNGWKSDPVVAAIVLDPRIGEAAAKLAGWPGARIGQDNVIWKPPGAKALGFHQDDSYCDWVVPPGYVTCWMALDETTAQGGTIEYARGSHRWGVFPPEGAFHAPENHYEALENAARRVGETPQVVRPEVAAGTCIFHHGGTFHGSGPNRGTQPRRSLITHCLSSQARFHADNVSYIYSRYRRRDSLDMDESFFPVLWTMQGYRTPWLDEYAGAARLPDRLAG